MEAQVNYINSLLDMIYQSVLNLDIVLILNKTCIEDLQNIKKRNYRKWKSKYWGTQINISKF